MRSGPSRSRRFRPRGERGLNPGADFGRCRLGSGARGGACSSIEVGCGRREAGEAVVVGVDVEQGRDLVVGINVEQDATWWWVSMLRNLVFYTLVID